MGCFFDNANDLAGLSARVAAAKTKATSRSRWKYVIGLQNTTQQPY
jgi:Zn-dependent oligopeptidase